MEQYASDYKSLVTNGLQLAENDFNIIINSLRTGAEEAKKFLNITDSDWPKFNFSNETHTLGYSHKHDAICISLNHMNQAGTRETQLEYKDQLLMFVPDVLYIIVKYVYWLKLLGRESTIHRYQKNGHESLKTKLPDSIQAPLTARQLLLSDIEVEARTLVDQISQNNAENTIWRNADAYFSSKYPQYYNKPIEELLKLPRPDFPLSFEMEFYSL